MLNDLCIPRMGSVENARLLPWLTGTALLHTGLTHWKTGRLRVLGFVMVVVTFLLCLFGTFLTRSGRSALFDVAVTGGDGRMVAVMRAQMRYISP